MPFATPITLGATADSAEVWSLFWQLGSYFNGNISMWKTVGYRDCLFPEYSSDLDSGALRHYKIGFHPGGHDHGGYGGGSDLTETGSIQRRHIDTNASSFLWTDYFDTGVGNTYEKHYVCMSGVASIVVTSGTGSAAIPYKPNQALAANYLDIDGDGVAATHSYYDDDADAWESWSYTTLGVIITVESSNQATNWGSAFLEGTYNSWKIVLTGYLDTTYKVFYTIFGRYTGSNP